jgi:hypothetical protein
MLGFFVFRTAYGNRTRDSSVKGMRLNPLTNAAFLFFGIAKVIRLLIIPKNISLTQISIDLYLHTL